MLTIVPDLSGVLPADVQESSVIDQIVREGARQMLAAALQAEVDGYIAQFTGERDENGHRLAVRNGAAEPRTVLTSAGAVQVTAPRVNDKRMNPENGERISFKPAILPPWARKTPQLAEVLPLLYLHGLSPGDFVPALGQFPGSSAGLSSSVITRLTEDWKAGAAAFMTRDLSGAGYVYVWADGIDVSIRLGEDKLCLLVMIGVRADGRKELIALADGYRESAGSWADCCATAPGAGCAPRCWQPATGHWDSGLGCARCSPRRKSSAAGSTRSQTCPGALPESAHPGANKALAGIWNAEDKDHARKAIKAFDGAYGAKFPRAAAKITGDEEELLAFYDYPAGHWIHLRTTSPVESAFATVRHRTKVTRGPGSKAAGLARPTSSSSPRSAAGGWSTPLHLVALVRAGAVFENGKLVERPEDQAPAATVQSPDVAETKVPAAA